LLVRVSAATHQDELERIDDLAARGDLRTLVRLLSDYVHAHRDQLPPPVRDKARVLLRKSTEVELNVDTLDPADLELARDRLQTQASRLLDILGNPEALALLEPSRPNGSPSGPPLGFAPGMPADGQRQRPPDRFAVIDAIGVTRTYQSSAFSLQPIDVTVRPKQILTIIGINGSGKSTLIDILRGELAPDRGTVYYPLLSHDPHDWQTIRSKIGYVPTRSRSWRGTVRENLEYAAAAHRITGTSNTETVDYLIDRHGLKHYEARTWSELSSGYRLRFDLALARGAPAPPPDPRRADGQSRPRQPAEPAVRPEAACRTVRHRDHHHLAASVRDGSHREHLDRAVRRPADQTAGHAGAPLFRNLAAPDRSAESGGRPGCAC
jgi:ABC-type transport system involved in cytochrome c biogenesis ATPase subunit